MLPYKPLPPAYGGKLAKKKKTLPPRTAALPKDPLAQGGPTERAVKLDLLELRRWYSTPEGGTQTHDNVGQAFAIFRSAFQRGRFGAIHTRAAPTRTDRDAYAQLLYSACFSLLHDAFESGVAEGGGAAAARTASGTMAGDAKCRSSIDVDLNAVEEYDAELGAFALFALYTLYETNPLPRMVPPPTAEERKPAISSLRHRHWSEREKALLGMLSLGMTAEEDQGKLFRRAFRSPIRINRKDWALLQRLKDTCLSRIAQCSASQIRRDQHISNSRWRCHCGEPLDVIHLIDRMEGEECFDLCEYTGPVSLEGLAGSSNFYSVTQSHWVGQAARAAVSQKPISEEQLAQIESFDLASLLDLRSLEGGYICKYQECLDSIAYPKRQCIESVQQKDLGWGDPTLLSFLKQRRRWGGAFTASTTCLATDIFHRICNANDDSSVDTDGLSSNFYAIFPDDGTPFPGHVFSGEVGTTTTALSQRSLADLEHASDLRNHQDAHDKGGISQARSYEDHLPLEVQHPKISTTDLSAESSENHGPPGIKIAFRIVLPRQTPETLKEGIRTALDGIMEDNEKIIKREKVVPKRKEGFHGDYAESSAGSLQKENADVTRTANQVLSPSYEENADSIRSDESGCGRAFLGDLLSRADFGHSGETVRHRGDRQAERETLNVTSSRPSKSPLDIMPNWSGFDDVSAYSSADESSIATGTGQSALQNLLARVDDQPLQKLDLHVKGISASNSVDGDLSMVTDTGRGALQMLLSTMDGSGKGCNGNVLNTRANASEDLTTKEFSPLSNEQQVCFDQREEDDSAKRQRIKSHGRHDYSQQQSSSSSQKNESSQTSTAKARGKGDGAASPQSVSVYQPRATDTFEGRAKDLIANVEGSCTQNNAGQQGRKKKSSKRDTGQGWKRKSLKRRRRNDMVTVDVSPGASYADSGKAALDSLLSKAASGV